MLQDQVDFVRTLSVLPQTLCHHDAALANLFACRDANGNMETVAVDWEHKGFGTVGADIATLVFGTMRRCDFDAEHAAKLDQVVLRVTFGAYANLDGKVVSRTSGWHIPLP